MTPMCETKSNCTNGGDCKHGRCISKILGQNISTAFPIYQSPIKKAISSEQPGKNYLNSTEHYIDIKISHNRLCCRNVF